MAVEVSLVERVYATFSGLRSREGALTVGQRNVLQWLGKPGTAAIGTTQWALSIPEGTRVEDVQAAFVTLLTRHESLRTTFDLGPEQRQRVAGEGRLPIDIYRAEGDPDETAVTARLLTRLRATAFDHSAEMPVRVALWVADGIVRAGMTLYSHIAFDIGGMAVVARELARVLADPGSVPTGPDEENWQPLDRAAWEASPAGQRRLDDSLRYWAKHLRTIAHCAYAVPAGRSVRGERADWAPPGSSAAARRSPAFELRSLAATLSVPHIAARTGTSPTMVVVAAFVAVLAHRARQHRCAFVTLVGNRMGRNVRGYVGTLAGPTLVVVDTGAGGFDELVRRTGSASLAASRHAVVDIAALTELSQGIYHERGVMYTRDVVVNNIHYALGQATADPAPPPLAAIPAALADTTVKWIEWERAPQLLNLRIFRLDATAVTFRIGTASAVRVPPTDLEMLARGMEGLLVAAAPGDVGRDRFTEVSGVEPVQRGPGWHLVDGCWVDVAQVRQLMTGALAPAVAAAFVEDGELVGYLAGGGIGSVERAHDRCVDALPGPAGLEYNTFTTIAPQRYVLCAAAPDNVDDLAAWRAQPVLASGPGR